MTREGAFTLIELMIVIAIVAIIAALAVPNLLEARKASNEAAAVSALRTIATAQSLFREGDKDKNSTLDYATSLDALATAAGVIDPVLQSGTKQGYLFSINSATQFTFSATASPAVPGKSGDRYFYVDESGVIRYNTTGSPSSASAPIGG